ncbi:hypothetical protein EV211_1131, partial [Aminicella lysinilytica]
MNNDIIKLLNIKDAGINGGCGHFLGLPMQLIQENACILPGSNNLVFPSF